MTDRQQAERLREGELPLCQLASLNQNANGRFRRRVSEASHYQYKSRFDKLPNGPQSSIVAGVGGVGWCDSPQSSAHPGSGHSTAPSSSKLIYNGSDAQRIFFPKEGIENVDYRDSTPHLDTSFSCDSLGSQVGSRQSLLDSRGKTRLITPVPPSPPVDNSKNRSCNAAWDMDLSRRQREARRKDIKDKLNLDHWSGERHALDKARCRWTFVFDPSGRLVYYWSVIVSLAFLYNFWVIIFRTAFYEISSETVIIWFPLDYLADFLYLMDILIHFRTAYLEDGVLQTDSTKLRLHYTNSTTFYVDMLCLLPLDFLYLSIHFQSMLRICRLVKIYRFWEFLDRTERHTNYPNLFRLCSLVHYLLVAFHWNSCVFYILHKNTGFGLESDLFGRKFQELSKLSDSNNNNDRDSEDQDIGMLYLMCYYWTILAMTTIGNLPHPQNKVQLVYVIFQLLVGLLVFATLLGYIATIVTNISAARKDFQTKLDGVKTYMRIRKVPGNIQNKVIKWFDYLWLTQKSSDEEKSISCLPDKLKGEIAIHVHLNTLKRVEIFQNTEAGFLCELVLRLRPVLFSPGDYICRKGEVGKEMYICNRGRLQVVDSDGKTVLATLKAGSYFGEISILNMGTAGNRRTASVRSVGYSDLFVLSKKDMWDVLKDYPAARVRLEAIAAKKLEKYKRVPLEKAALPRSKSTPGLLESRGRIPLEEMWVSPLPIYTPENGSPVSQKARGRKETSSPVSFHSIQAKRRQDNNSPVSQVSSRIRRAQDNGSPVSQHSVNKARHDPAAARRDCGDQSASSTAKSPKHNVNVIHVGHKDIWGGEDTEDVVRTPHTFQVIGPTPTPSPSSITSSYSNTQHILSINNEACRTSAGVGALLQPAGGGGSHSGSGSLQSNNSGHPLQPAPSRLMPRPVHKQGHQHQPLGDLLQIKPGHENKQEELLTEIKRLRERLKSLESENASLSMAMSQSQREVDQRLTEIEYQIGGEDSGEISESTSFEEEKNQESFI